MTAEVRLARKILLRLTLLALAVQSLPASAAAAACDPPRGYKAFLRTRSVVLSVMRVSSGGDPIDATETSTWTGCLRSSGRRVVLDHGAGGFSAVHYAHVFRVSAPFVAFLSTDSRKGDEVTVVEVVDLSTDRRWTSEQAAGFTALAVSHDGDAAWIRSGYDRHGRVRLSLYLERSGRVTLVDRSFHGLSGLRLTRTHLVWKKAGRRRILRLSS